MLTTDQFFAAFDRAGLLVMADWQPANGAPAQSAKVRFRSPDELLLGQMAVGTAYAIEYPVTSLVGLDENEIVTVAGTAYRVREKPLRKSNGAVMRALLGAL